MVTGAQAANFAIEFLTSFSQLSFPQYGLSAFKLLFLALGSQSPKKQMRLRQPATHRELSFIFSHEVKTTAKVLLMFEQLALHCNRAACG